MIRIIADSTCDLSREIAKEYNIKIISSKVVINGESLNDYDYYDESLNEFYTHLDEIEGAPDYETPTPEAYKDAIEEGLFNGVTEFLILIPSSQQIDDFAGVVNTAINSFMETNRVPGVKIHMINTLNVSQGFGYSVLKAAKLVKEGKTFEQIIDIIEANKNKVKAFLSVPDVDFLYKTGNVTRAGANASKALGITPVLKLGTTGKATLASKAIGNNKVAQCFSNEFKRNGDIEANEFILIGYSTDSEQAMKTKVLLEQEVHYKGEIHVIQMRPAFGAHMGRGATAIYFMGKQGTIALFNIFRTN